MHRFTDAFGREWLFQLNRTNVRKLWDLLRLNLHDPADVARLCKQERFLLLPQVLEVLQHAEAERVWPEAAGKPAELLEHFDEVLQTDEVFDQAHTAFCAELADFCRSRGRAALAKYLDATPRLLAKENAANMAQLPDVASLEAELDRRLPIPGDSSTNSPASAAESIPAA